MTVKVGKGVFNRAYLPLLRDEEHRYIILYGGAGSGKSVFAAQRYILRLLEKPMCNLLVVRKVGNTHKYSTYALFKQIIGKWRMEKLFHWVDSEMRIDCINGNGIIFKGLDDPEKLKSVTFPGGEVTDIWIEEASEISEGDFNQMDVRLRGLGGHKQLVLSFNPISAGHWLKKRFFDRREKRAIALKTTYKDNGFLDGEFISTLESYKESDPYYYAVYCLGEWGVTGETVFDAGKVTQRLGEIGEPVARGEFICRTVYDGEENRMRIEDGSIRFIELGGGGISIYKEPKPGGQYVIGGDTAGEGEDYFTGQVVDCLTGEQVCTLRGRMGEEEYTRQMYCLGMYYHGAMIAIEENFSTYPIKELNRLGYPRQYVRREGKAGKRGIGYGFKTTAMTRPVILSGLMKVVKEHPEWLNDRDTLEEMMAFVRNPKGRPEAGEGAHDDCVMALAIAYHCRDRGESEVFYY